MDLSVLQRQWLVVFDELLAIGLKASQILFLMGKSKRYAWVLVGLLWISVIAATFCFGFRFEVFDFVLIKFLPTPDFNHFSNNIINKQ